MSKIVEEAVNGRSSPPRISHDDKTAQTDFPNPPTHRRHLSSSTLLPFFKILVAWIGALALALGHHAYNSSLDGKTPTEEDVSVSVVRSQAGASALNTAFAFLVSFFLGITASSAFVQCAWVVVQQRSFTLEGLDALWSCTSSALAFISWDFLRNGRWIVLVAAISWAFPVIVTFAPGSLSVRNQVISENITCGVPAFDFGSSAAFYDQLAASAAAPYSGPSAVASRLVGTVLLGGQPLPPPSPCGGSNCTYHTTFEGPSFSCSSGVQNASLLDWGFTTQNKGPAYFGAQFDSIAPTNNSRYANWDFAGYFANAARFLPIPESNETLTCVSFNSTYHLLYSFSGSIPSVAIESIVLNQPASQMLSDPLFVEDQPGVHSAAFNATTNYYALLSSLYASLVGNITTDLTGDSVSFTYATPTQSQGANLPVIQSELVSSLQNGNLNWTTDVVSGMESLLANITLSILTLSEVAQTTPATCVYSIPRAYFSYDSHRLLLIYGVGLGCVLLVALIGMLALWRNPLDFGKGSGFTDFLAATRNSELNDIDFVGRDAQAAKRVRLRFGTLRDSGGRIAFGFPESLSMGGGVDGEATYVTGLYQMVPLAAD